MEHIAFIAVVVLALGFAWWAAAQDKKRVEALVQWQEASGFEPGALRRDDPGWNWDLFRRGHSRYAQAIAAVRLPRATPGLDGASATIFEYHYAITSGSGRNRRTRHYWRTCAIVELAFDPGHVSFEAEGVGDKLAAMFGFDDIDFEDAEFSKRFKVEAERKKDAWDLLDGAMMTWLKDHPGVQFESRGRQALVVLESPGKASPARFEALLAWSRGFLAQIPRPLVNSERARLSQAPLVEAGNAATTSRAARA